MSSQQVYATVLIVLGGVMWIMWKHARDGARVDAIRHHPLPFGVYKKLRETYPELTHKDCQLAAQALRQFFLAYLGSGFRFVAMPSRAADELWHAFILHTQEYEKFCKTAFGRFLHHNPAVALDAWTKQSNEGLRRTWWHVCRDDNIDPRQPTRLPLLFALDAKLKLQHGFRYVLGDRRLAPTGAAAIGITYTGELSSADVDGSLDGFGDGSADGGGDGCGGGCGGGD